MKEERDGEGTIDTAHMIKGPSLHKQSKRPGAIMVQQSYLSFVCESDRGRGRRLDEGREGRRGNYRHRLHDKRPGAIMPYLSFVCESDSVHPSTSDLDYILAGQGSAHRKWLFSLHYIFTKTQLSHITLT